MNLSDVASSVTFPVTGGTRTGTVASRDSGGNSVAVTPALSCHTPDGAGTNMKVTSAADPLPVALPKPTPVFSIEIEGGHVLKASAGTLLRASARIDSTLASGTYYVQLHNAASAPADGTSAFLMAPVKIQHISGIDDGYDFDIPAGGVAASSGIYVCISSMEFTKTIVASAGTFEGMVV